ncbi:hypothetical protein AAFP32_10095 [Brevibacterium sp. CBA3109]|uniref:Schlafen AlbA-2 domain-containing protein n=1 Tax=Brevibacterium koreense TaxID=3140787 RepID=A0AAU7UIG7_9MICO
MRAIDLETQVLAAVERIRKGEKTENDLIECKRAWPSNNKARQLAGSLNRAAGDAVIYVIGIDEKDGSIHDTSDTDILDWWSQIVGQFDQVPAEMVRHIDVPISNESVVGIAFSSDRAPYVVKTGSPKPSLEIPIREGTGTRTARRDEVLRMLAPAIRVPAATVLESNFSAVHYPPLASAENAANDYRREESVHAFGTADFFVEHDGRDLVTLPTHAMDGIIEVGDLSFTLNVTPDWFQSETKAPRKEYIDRQREAVLISGPGVVPLRVDVEGLLLSHRKLLETTNSVTVRLHLGILHTSKPLVIEMELNTNPREHQLPEDLNRWSVRGK